MNKNELISKVADDTGLSKSDASKAVDSIFDSITGELKSGGDIRLVGFGTFLVTKRNLPINYTSYFRFLTLSINIYYTQKEKHATITNFSSASRMPQNPASIYQSC